MSRPRRGLRRAGTRIVGRLAAARAERRGAVDDLGDADVVDGVERFEERWRDGRKDIKANADTLGQMLLESVRTYREADRELPPGLTVGTSGGAR